MLSLEGVLAAAVAVALVVSLWTVRRLERPDRRWRDRLRARLVMGVPWGTLVVAAFVLAVYLVVQDGVTDVENPVVLPYRAWSYFYPLGMVTAPFSHASFGHLVGNLIGTLVAAPIAEYAWGHHVSSSDDRRSNRVPSWLSEPWVRAVVLFPLAVIGVGLLTSLFALGPVIGFSGVVYAFVGFAIVRYPITTLVATLGVQGAAVTTFYALRNPIYVYEVSPSPPTAPGWATTAIQGHALGFLLGFVLAVAVFTRRGHRPSPFRLWLAVLLYAFSSSLWAIYWFRDEAYVLFRGPGIAIVTILALVVTLSATGSDRPLVPDRLRRLVPGRSAHDGPDLERILAIGRPSSTARVRDLALAADPRPDAGLSDLTRRQGAVVAVVLVLALVAGPALAANAFVVDADLGEDGDTEREAVTVEDYTITYVESVENEMISIVDIEAFGEESTVEASGVVVSSPERHLWMEAVSTGRLAFDGTATVEVGGPGWRETVHVERRGWSAVGNDTVYQVRLWAEGDDPRLAYASDPLRTNVRIDDRRVSIDADDEFVLAVTAPDGETERVAVPGENATATANGLTFEREDDAIYASADGTEVQVASKEEYEGG